MKKRLHFVRDFTTYYSIGQPTEYYYDLDIIPLKSSPCNDILEKTRFLYALWELFTTSDSSNPKGLISSLLLIDLKKYFEKYEDTDFAYYTLLEYETLEKEDTSSCIYELEKSTNNLVLFASNLKIIIPRPYENLVGEDRDEVDESNYSEFKLLTFTQDDDFPILFMSDQQKEDNEVEINKYVEEISLIFKNHQVDVNNCEDLLNIYNNNC